MSLDLVIGGLLAPHALVTGGFGAGSSSGSTLALATGGLTGYSDLVTGGLGQGTIQTYPVFRADFEAGTIVSAGLYDPSSAYAISTTHAFTGTHGISNTLTSGADLLTVAADALGGNVKVTGYFYPIAVDSFQLRARVQPAGTDATTWVLASFGVNGLTLVQDVSGTQTTLNTAISGVTIPTGAWLCLELAVNGTAVTGRLLNETTGLWFQHSGSGSWVSTPQTVSGTLVSGPTGVGSIEVRLGNSSANAIYFDDLIYDPATPSIDHPTFSISSAGGTQQLTAGGFTDPIRTNPGGVTWASSNTAIAVVGATTGLVTAIGNGSATITATGIRDTSQAATATATISGQTGTALEIITIDCTTAKTTPQVSLTNEVVIVPLASHTFNFAGLNSNGRNLEVLGIDGATPLAATLRTWNTGVGLRLIERLKGPSVDGRGNTIYVGIGVAVGNLGLANPPHTVWNTGSDLTGNGIITTYDRFGNVLWNYPGAADYEGTAVAIADINGDGVNEVITSYALPGSNTNGGVFCLSASGSLLWNWANTPFSGHNTYCRGIAVAKLRGDYLNLQAVMGGAYGHVALIDYQGNTIWLDTTHYLGNIANDQTVQNVIVDDLNNSGTPYIFFTVGNQLFKVSGANVIAWTYTDPLSVDNVHYNLASGHITSTIVKQIVVTGATGPPLGISQLGSVTVVDDTGAVVWTKFFPFPLYSVSVGDVNADGYDEILLTAGSALNYGMTLGWGAVIILDKNGIELTAGSIASSSKFSTYADYNGDGIKELNVSCDSGVLYRYAFDPVGGSIKVTIPALAANALDTITVTASSSATNVPPQGDFFFDATGSNGTAPPGMDQRTGVWTVQSGTIQGPSDGDTSYFNALEATGVSTDGLEMEYTAVQDSQGTGGSTYYHGIWYRCSSWSGSPLIPNGYLARLRFDGQVNLVRFASGNSTGTAVYGLTSSGPTFNTTDSIRVRITASGNDHAMSYQKNGGPWITAYRVQDTFGTPLTASGTVALYTSRGQTQFSSIVLQAIPSAYGAPALNGPAPDIVPAFLAPTTATLSGPAGGVSGSASSPFTVTLNQPASVADSFPVTYSGGSITTSPVVIPVGWMSATFYVTPSGAGAANVVLGAGTTGLTVAGTPISYTASGQIPVYPAAMMLGL